MQALAFGGEAIGESESDRRWAGSQLESVKKHVNALDVGFPAVFHRDDVAKQMGRCNTMTSIVAKLSDVSKIQYNDMIVGIPIALTSKTDDYLNLQASAFWTLMKEPISFLGSSLNGAAAIENT